MIDAADTAPSKKQRPRYQITEKCYLKVPGPGGEIERVLDPEAQPEEEDRDTGERVRRPLIIEFEGVPAHYMIPVNQAAKDMAKKFADRMSLRDPINSLTTVA